MEIYNATRLVIAPPARMLVRRFAGPQPPDDAAPEINARQQAGGRRRCPADLTAVTGSPGFPPPAFPGGAASKGPSN